MRVDGGEYQFHDEHTLLLTNRREAAELIMQMPDFVTHTNQHKRLYGEHAGEPLSYSTEFVMRFLCDCLVRAVCLPACLPHTNRALTILFFTYHNERLIHIFASART